MREIDFSTVATFLEFSLIFTDIYSQVFMEVLQLEVNSLSASWMRMLHELLASFTQLNVQDSVPIHTRWKHCCMHSTNKQSTLASGEPLTWPHWSSASSL